MGLSSGSVSHLCLYQSFKATYSSRWRAVHPPLALTRNSRNQWLILCYYSWLQKTVCSIRIFQAFMGCFQRSRTPHPFICTVGSVRGSSLWSTCSALGAQSLKCTAPQLFPSIGGYLQWLQLQKKKSSSSSEKEHKSKKHTTKTHNDRKL